MFSFFFGKPNPTAQWPVCADPELIFDLDSGALNGVGLGQPLQGLELLGPDEGGKAFRDGEFCYYAMGICLHCEDEDWKIVSFQFVQRDDEENLYMPFRGTVLHNGQSLELWKLTRMNCENLLGDCFWEDKDETETILFYEFAGSEWQLEFGESAQLSRLIVTSQPIMADPQQREAYGVTKPWPSEWSKHA